MDTLQTFEFGTYPDHGHYGCQKNAWMDKEMMHKRIDLVLVPWRNSKVLWTAPIIIFDAYRDQMMGTTVNQIQTFQIEAVHISPSCKYLCRPVDIGINMTIKTGMREKWEDWMLDGLGIVDGTAKDTSRKFVAEWLV